MKLGLNKSLSKPKLLLSPKAKNPYLQKIFKPPVVIVSSPQVDAITSHNKRYSPLFQISENENLEHTKTNFLKRGLLS